MTLHETNYIVYLWNFYKFQLRQNYTYSYNGWHSAPSMSSVLATIAISMIYRLDFTNNQVATNNTVTRETWSESREEKSSVLTSKNDDRAHRRITWPNQMKAKEKERERKEDHRDPRRLSALRRDAKIAMTCDWWSTGVGTRMYNFANSNLKTNLTMQRGDPRGVRGVSFAIRTCAYKHACAISSAINVRVTYAGVTSEISCAYTRLCLWRRIYLRFSFCVFSLL